MWYMDGTFKVMHDPFKPGQLMSIHGFVQRDGVEKQIPLMFVLMSRRSKTDYVQVFLKIQEACGELAVEGVMLDFEPAAWLAVRFVFPDIEVKGCVFHWTQAVWKQVLEKGLKPAYSQRSSIYNYIRQLLALPFLPARHIRPTFNQLRDRANTEPLQRLVDYMHSTWMTNSIFDVEAWSVFGCSVRTNNDVEGWHHRLNSRAGHIGLTFYRMVPVLRKEAQLAIFSTSLVAAGTGGRDRRPTYRRLEAQIQKLWEKYRTGEITTGNLLRSCARLYGPSDR